VSRYKCTKLNNLSPLHGFLIYTPDDRTLKDLHPQFIVRELNRLNERIKRLEEAGEFLDDVADAADDDIREHLQVANYNLHGLLNTGERIQPLNPPQTIHQAGIDASVAVREDIRKARKCWKEAKEATP
jgi:hypothetical protein